MSFCPDVSPAPSRSGVPWIQRGGCCSAWEGVSGGGCGAGGCGWSRGACGRRGCAAESGPGSPTVRARGEALGGDSTPQGSTERSPESQTPFVCFSLLPQRSAVLHLDCKGVDFFQRDRGCRKPRSHPSISSGGTCLCAVPGGVSRTPGEGRGLVFRPPTRVPGCWPFPTLFPLDAQQTEGIGLLQIPGWGRNPEQGVSGPEQGPSDRCFTGRARCTLLQGGEQNRSGPRPHPGMKNIAGTVCVHTMTQSLRTRLYWTLCYLGRGYLLS